MDTPFVSLDNLRQRHPELQEWKREFEVDGTTLGKLREEIRAAVDFHKFDWPIGCAAEFRNLNYISHPLHSERISVPQFFKSHIGGIKDLIKPDQSKRKYILKDINIKLPEGSMTLVLGSPGSGKSSLCKIIANQEINGIIEGELLFGGTSLHEDDHSHRIAYVRDTDIHLAHLTVKQTFEYAFDMLNPPVTAERREWVISSVLDVLGLSHRADTIVGDDLNRGISGGERRRVSIGVELMKRSQLLVLDEPTTGLDSSVSLQIFQAFRVIADEFSPLLATLKQPGRELYNLFDNVVVLHKGQIVYKGTTDEMMEYFEFNGYSVNRAINPADEVLSLVDKFGDELVDLYKQTGKHQNASDSLPPPRSAVWRNTDNSEYEPSPQVQLQRFARSFCSQFLLTTKRGFQIVRNNPDILTGRIFFALLMALIIGTLFWQLDHNQQGLKALQGCLFLVGLFPAYMSLAGLPTIFEVRPVFYYQRENNYYHAIPVILSNFLVSLPIVFTESIVFSTICYWMIGFNDSFARYVCFTLVVVSIASLFNIIVAISGFILPSFLTANILIPEIVFVLNFFTGFVVQQERAPVYLQWLYWVTPFRYVLESLSINEFADSKFHCESSEVIPPNDYSLLNSLYESGGFEGHQMCPVTSGDEILLDLGYQSEWAWAWYFLLVIIAYNLGAFFVMFITSYFKFKPSSPRDLEKLEEQEIQLNESLDEFKNSIFSNSDPIPLTISKEGKRLETNVPVVIEWENLTYTVQVPASKQHKRESRLRYIPGATSFMKENHILVDNVSGYVKPGMLVAFMGPSGAGKTTLLDVLAQRKSVGRITGEIRMNGLPIDSDILSRVSGYVEQQNIHVETETVAEALMMSASLRLSFPVRHYTGERKISRTDRLEHVTWVMNILNLSPIRGALISELSLEQKKRFTIAVELAANPSVLWLDEPTSGLDSMAALSVMRAVKRISENGVAVICTLHQPSELLFSWSTHLLLLAQGGKMVFFGESSDNNHSAKLFFSQFHSQPDNGSDAEYFLDCCSSKELNQDGQSVTEAFLASEDFIELQQILKNQVPRKDIQKLPWYKNILGSINVQEENQEDEWPVPRFSNSTARSPFVQWCYLASRNMRRWWRSPLPLLLILGNSVMYGIVLALLFSETDNSQYGATEKVSLFFFVAVVVSALALSYTPQIFGERPAMYRETSSKTYRPVAYLISMVSVNLSLLLITGMIIMIPVWISAGLRHSWYHSAYYFGTGIGLAVTDYLLLMLLCFLSSGAEMGNGLYAIVNILQFMVNGFLLHRPDIPVYWVWAYWIAEQHYALEGFLINQLKGTNFDCHHNEGAFPVPVPSETDPLRVQYYCPFESGEDVLESIEVHDSWIWKIVDISVLFGISSVLFFLCAIVISKIRHINR